MWRLPSSSVEVAVEVKVGVVEAVGVNVAEGAGVSVGTGVEVSLGLSPHAEASNATSIRLSMVNPVDLR